MNNPFIELYEEHGLLDRILTIYEKWITLLDKDVSPSIMMRAAKIVQECIEGHHEKVEEKFIFPLVPGDLVKTLTQQHADGKKLTSTILQNLSNPFVPWRVVTAAREFVVMYRRHMNLEDTVTYPAATDKLSDSDLVELGAIVKSLGGGEKKAMATVETLEKKLDIS